ncbi:MAG: hypothetical protein HY920_01800 [Elusimicrobia bacterium]|nr:hypothetical protein [Elusimicrobiota bacterium]
MQQNNYQELKRIIENLVPQKVKEITEHVVHEIDLFLATQPKLKDLQQNKDFQKIAWQKAGENGNEEKNNMA